MENIEENIRSIKNDFFAFRNGIVADSLRKLYPAATMIYGLTVPQFVELSKKYPHDFELADALWKDGKSRESRIFSFYLFPVNEIREDYVVKMLIEVMSREEAELLAFKVLKNLPKAKDIYLTLSNQTFDNPNSQYCLEMFRKNLQM